MDDTPTPRRRTPAAIWIAVSAAIAATVTAVTAWALWPSPRGRLTEPSSPPSSTSPSADASPEDGVPSPDTPPGAPSAELESGDDNGSSGCDPGCDSIISDTCNSITDEVCGSVVEQTCDAITAEACSAGSCGSSTISYPVTSSQFLATAAAGMVVMPLALIDRFGPKASERTAGDRARVPITARIAVAAIGRYRRRLAPRTSIRCRFTPTCSVYGAAVIERHGLVVGARLAMRRIRRCRANVPLGTPDPPG